MSLPITQSLHQAVIHNLKFLEESKLDTGVIKTLFKNIDDKYGGLALGEFIILGGNKSIGKTPFLINLALNISLLNPVLYISFEESNSALTNRFISSAAEISLTKITEQSLDFYDEIVLNEVRKNIKNHKIYISDKSAFATNKFKEYCIEQIEQNGIKLIVVDYLQKMSIDYYKEITELKAIATENNICIIGASQFSQKLYHQTNLSDLPLDSSIIALADKIIVMSRPEYFGIDANEMGESLRDITKLSVLNNNQGVLLDFKFINNINFTKFTEL